jgi:peptidoglycan/LPS O-acetylase OafA/YrhL
VSQGTSRATRAKLVVIGVVEGSKRGVVATPAGSVFEAAVRRPSRLGPIRRFAVTLGLTGIALLVSAFFYIPAQVDSNAFAGAPVCSTGTQTAGCIAHVPATITLRGQTGSGNDATSWVDLQGVGSATSEVDLGHGYSVWSSLQAGQTVTAVVWRNQIVALDARAGTMETSNWPDHRTVDRLWPFTMFLGLFLSSLIYVIGSQLRIPARRAWTVSFAAGCVVFSAMGYALVALIADRPVPLAYPPLLAAMVVVGLVARQLFRRFYRLRLTRKTRKQA